MRLHSIVKQIMRWWETPPDETPLQESIRLTERALRRYHGQIDEMNRQWGGLCCPACQWGSVYMDVIDKIERVEDWLKILRTKEAMKNDERNAAAVN